MVETFASSGDMAVKKISFTEIGRDLYAFTAEGDPNNGVIIGDDGVMVVDVQATPVMAKQVVDRIRTVTDKPIKYVVLSHYHAVRVLGASGYGAQHILSSDTCRAMIHERGMEDWQSEFGRFHRLFQASELHSRPHLADDDLRDVNDDPYGQAPRRSQASRSRPHGRRYCRPCARRRRPVHGRHRGISLGLLLRRCSFHGLAENARSYRRFRHRGHRAGTGRRADRPGTGGQGHRRHPQFHPLDLSARGQGRGSRGLVEGRLGRLPRRLRRQILKLCAIRALSAVQCRARLRRSARHRHPRIRIWTADRDRDMWTKLQG